MYTGRICTTRYSLRRKLAVLRISLPCKIGLASAFHQRYNHRTNMTTTEQVSEPKPSIRKPFGAVVKKHAAEQAAHRKEHPRNSPWQTTHSRNRHYLRHLSLAYAFARGAAYIKVESPPKAGRQERPNQHYIFTLLREVLPAMISEDSEKNIGKWLRGKYPTPAVERLTNDE